MFVKLTKMDGSPLWVNANYVVTVEPSRTGGAVVVPLGDGLDYDVRETPEEVMQMVSGEVSAPKRTKRATSKKAKDEGDAESDAKPGAEAEPSQQGRGGPAASADEGSSASRAKPAAAKKSAAVRKAKPEVKQKPETQPEPDAKVESAPQPEPMSVFPEEIPSGDFSMSDSEIERLRKFAPKSIRKLYNTLVSQFGVTDPKAVSMYLVDKRVISIDKTHVNWISEPAADPANVGEMTVQNVI